MQLKAKKFNKLIEKSHDLNKRFSRKYDESKMTPTMQTPKYSKSIIISLFL